MQRVWRQLTSARARHGRSVHFRIATAKAVAKFSKANAKALLTADLDRVKLAKRPLPYETLDQLTLEIIMGVR